MRILFVLKGPLYARNLEFTLRHLVERGHRVHAAFEVESNKQPHQWELMERLCKKKPVAGVAYSAFDEPEHISRSKMAGFSEHVVKGTTPETLVAAINRIAKGREFAEAAVAATP